MLYVSILTSDRERDPELWATLWQGEAPKGLEIVAVYNLQNDVRVFIINAEPPQAIGWLDRLNAVGTIVTTPAFDRTQETQAGSGCPGFESAAGCRGRPRSGPVVAAVSADTF